MFKTTDILLAAYLRCRGVTLSGIEVVAKKGTFTFDDAPDDYITEFDLGRAVVEPKRFNGTVKELTLSCKRMTK